MRGKITGYIIVFMLEILAGTASGGIIASVLVPYCLATRGYFAIGTEWILIIAAAYGGYTLLNQFFFSKTKGRD